METYKREFTYNVKTDRSRSAGALALVQAALSSAIAEPTEMPADFSR